MGGGALGPHHPAPGELAEMLMRPDSAHLPVLNPNYKGEPSCCHHLPLLPPYLPTVIPAKETEVGDPRPTLSMVLDQI